MGTQGQLDVGLESGTVSTILPGSNTGGLPEQAAANTATTAAAALATAAVPGAGPAGPAVATRTASAAPTLPDIASISDLPGLLAFFRFPQGLETAFLEHMGVEKDEPLLAFAKLTDEEIINISNSVQVNAADIPMGHKGKIRSLLGQAKTICLPKALPNTGSNPASGVQSSQLAAAPLPENMVENKLVVSQTDSRLSACSGTRLSLALAAGPSLAWNLLPNSYPASKLSSIEGKCRTPISRFSVLTRVVHLDSSVFVAPSSMPTGRWVRSKSPGLLTSRLGKERGPCTSCA